MNVGYLAFRFSGLVRAQIEGSRDHVGYLPFRFSGLMESGKQNLKETFGLNSGAYNQAAFGLIYFLM